jgi:8-oxo-dGTP diphosphatase
MDSRWIVAGTAGPVTAEDAAALVAEAEDAGIDRLVVGAVIAGAGKVLLLLRREDDFMPGIFELPSGKVETGESLLEALAREVAEETGLVVTGVDAYLGAFDYTSGSGKATRQFNFTLTVAALAPVVLSEHADHIWAPVVDGIPVSTDVARVLGRFKELTPN